MKLIGSLRKHYLKMVSPPHREMYAAYKRFRRDRAEVRRYDFPFLNQDSVVFDLGGYQGEWAEGIFVRYGATVHVFEPHPEFAGRLQEKYQRNSKIHVHACALSSRDGEFTLSDLADGSSSQRKGGRVLHCRTVEAGEYLKSLGVESVDLMKVNIEGGEYDILPHLHQIGFLKNIQSLQIQFHLFGEPNIADRERIRGMLREHHQEAWCYPFIWEHWDRRDRSNMVR